MSRLYDRVTAEGCRPLSARDVMERSGGLDAMRGGTRERLVGTLGREPTREEVAEDVSRRLSALGSDRASDVFDPASLADAVVIAADEVGRYFLSLGEGTNIADVVSALAPPFDRFFVEFDNAPDNVLQFASWGVFFVEQEPRHEEEGWLMSATLVGEWRRGKPVGPVMKWVVPLDSYGYLFEGDDRGYGSLFGQIPDIEGVPAEAAFEFGDGLGELLGSALLAISFLHCKNVSLRTIEPPEKLTKKARKRHGRPLTRYHVLQIEPMRRILDTEGEAHTKGLRHALHICRGHFKTFTEEAPLFGRHTGTYWWPAHVRGSADQGVVDKDYRIRLDDGLGQTYRSANEEVIVAAAEVKPDDPDTSERGLRAHNRIQNLLAHHVEEAGFSPRSPSAGEPDFDLAWQENGTVWVAEVKSTTERTEEHQLRLGIGQVLRYRQQLSGEGREVRAMIAVENAPFDESFIDLCGREGIALVWPEVMGQALAQS